MHALILGGAGSAGRKLIRQLLDDGGPPVAISVVSRTATSMPGGTRVLSGHYGELAYTAEFRQYLAGVDVIVHLADGLSVLQQPGRAAEVTEADRLVAASEQLAQAARLARVPHF